jgi:hypothetical protein
MYSLEILNPTAAIGPIVRTTAAAPRPSSLDGLTVDWYGMASEAVPKLWKRPANSPGTSTVPQRCACMKGANLVERRSWTARFANAT